MKRALVTGAAGFVGRHMVNELAARGWDVFVVDVAGPIRLDCLDLFRATRDAYPDWTIPVYDLVVHAAARAPHRAAIDGQPATGIYNRLLDAAMFEWAVRTRQRRVLYLSSSAVYPQTSDLGERPYREDGFDPWVADYHDGFEVVGTAPADAYGWAKVAGEQMAEQAREAGVPVTVVRPFSGYGEDQSEDFPFGAFVARARRRENPFRIWGDGLQTRDWIHVDDVVRGALAAAESGTADPVNLCTGVGTSMCELVGMICGAAGYDDVPEFEFDLTAPAGVSYRVGDPSRMREFYTPQVSLAEGVARAFAGAVA